MDLTSALSSLGPWGVLAGVGLTLAGQFIRNRLTSSSTPSAPAPPAPSQTPILDALLSLIASKLLPSNTAPAPAAPVATDISHATAATVIAQLFAPTPATTTAPTASK